MCNNKIISELQKYENDQHRVNTEEVSKACKNERFILLKIIMVILHKHVKKCDKEKKQKLMKKIASNTSTGISKSKIVSNTSVGINTAKISGH